MLFDRIVKTVNKSVSHLTCNLASISLFNLADNGVACATRDRCGSHGAAAHCLMYFLTFGFIKACAEILHNFSVAADAACTRIAACDNLTEDGDIGINSVIALSTGKTDTEACYNFVANKKCAVLAAKSLNALREIFINRACC